MHTLSMDDVCDCRGVPLALCSHVEWLPTFRVSVTGKRSLLALSFSLFLSSPLLGLYSAFGLYPANLFTLLRGKRCHGYRNRQFTAVIFVITAAPASAFAFAAAPASAFASASAFAFAFASAFTSHYYRGVFHASCTRLTYQAFPRIRTGIRICICIRIALL